MKDRAYGKLISRDPDKFWTGGQWMTERKGGSDVGEWYMVCGLFDCQHFLPDSQL